MDDASKQSQSFGSGQQRSPHSRPFFYVQPPSQPYYLYPHWQLNNPYSHFGLPGAFNFGRPCMHPYQFMQYPGFVLPHASIYPVDYRRMFETRFQAPIWGDVPRQPQQQQYCHPQPHGRRETACSEAQTDPSDAITKLIECLDKIRANELQSANRELDSGVASQSSGMFSPGEEKKNEEHGYNLPSESTPANECSQMILDTLSPQGCWSGRLEEEPPLDSSSVHEECPELMQSAADQDFLCLGKEEVTDIQSDISVTDQNVPRCDAEEPHNTTPALLLFSSSEPPLKDDKSSNHASKVEHPPALNETNVDQNYQILKLPFDSILTPGSAESGRFCSPAASYYYNYLSMQTTHERMSVLSPSLDELSSREEMFSTDLEDVDLFPKHVYTGRRLTEVISRSPQAAEDVEVWRPGLKTLVCACCGKSLAKGTSRSKVHSSKMYRDEAGDSEEEVRYGRECKQPVRVVVRKHSAARKTHPLPQRHAKSWYRRGLCKEASDAMDQDEDHGGCKQELAEGDTEELDSSELQCRTCQDRLCRDDLTTSDHGRWADGDVIPRRRQEMSTQWNVMYHRPRDEDQDDDEPPPLHWERDMEAATSTLQHLHGLGPRGPNPLPAAPQPQGPPQPAPGHTAAPRPEEQHHKPFFYIQPSQPYMPIQSMQWPVPVPMPMSYNPYYAYPGLGYGMPLMPHYQPNPYMEPPGFVVPHAHLHLMDYRRMLNPQYYQTMAYHSRRFRYQHNSPTREMTSSEVQTEPLSATQNTSTPSSSEAESSSVLPVCSGNATGVSSHMLSPALDLQEGNHSPECKDMVPSSITRATSNGSFVIQTEEVRIECCTTPVGLQLLHALEAAEASHGFSQDMVQCSSILQGHVLQDEGICLPADQSEQALQVCPDILLVGTPSTGENTSAPEESGNQMVPVISSLESQEAACGESEEMSESDLCTTSKNGHLKVAHLQFDNSYLDELRKIESSVWSVEETLVPSPESLIQNGPRESLDATLTAIAEVTSEKMLTEEAPTEVIPMTKMSPLEKDESEAMVSTVDYLGDEMVSDADICPMMDEPILEEAPKSKQTCTAEVTLAPNLQQLANSPLEVDGSQCQQSGNVQDCQDTSFESLPAYLPSTSWLTDFDHIYYCNRFPQAPKKQMRPANNQGLDMSTRRRKLDLEYKRQPNIRKPKEKYKPKGKVDRQSFSDHECCLSRNFSENTFSPYVPKRERLCSRCLTKRRLCMSASPGLDGLSLKRKAFQQWNDALLPTCEACKSHTKRQLIRKGSNTDVCSPHRGHETEGESSENSSCRTGSKWRPSDDPRKLTDLKRPLTCKQNLEKSPAGMYPKLREKNSVCNELQHQPVAWERLRHCSHGNAIREIDENCAMPLQDKLRNMDQIYLTHRWQTEKSWRDMTPNTDTNGSKNEARAQHLNKHKKAQPQSQGPRTRDTRC